MSFQHMYVICLDTMLHVTLDHENPWMGLGGSTVQMQHARDHKRAHTQRLSDTATSSVPTGRENSKYMVIWERMSPSNHGHPCYSCVNGPLSLWLSPLCNAHDVFHTIWGTWKKRTTELVWSHSSVDQLGKFGRCAMPTASIKYPPLWKLNSVLPWQFWILHSNILSTFQKNEKWIMKRGENIYIFLNCVVGSNLATQIVCGLWKCP